MAEDSDTFVEITENFERFSGYFVNGNPVSKNIEQSSIISCAEVKRRADMYGSFVKNMQTDDLRYGLCIKKWSSMKVCIPIIAINKPKNSLHNICG